MATPHLEFGSVLDGFTIGNRVHEGGMAVLYEVSHPDHAIPLLMKVPLLTEGEDPAAKKLKLNQARLHLHLPENQQTVYCYFVALSVSNCVA